MKPITDIKTFLKRFNNFVNAEFRSIEIISATSMKIIFATQDEARAFDWLTIELEFTEIFDAKLLDDSKLSFIDMDSGITLLQEDNKVGFCIGKYNMNTLKDSICYILSSNVKYTEGQF